MTAYERGNAFERRVVDHLRDEGYQCWQTRGSKSAADIIAIKAHEILLVQAKSGVNGITAAEWNRLLELARTVGATALLADRPRRGEIRYARLIAHKTRRGVWPSEPWAPDTVPA